MSRLIAILLVAIPVTALADDSEFDEGPEETKALIARETDGFVPDGKPIAVSLDKFAPVRLSVKRAKCYVAVLALAPNAAFSDHARHGLGVETSVGRQVATVGTAVSGGVVVARLGCPQAKGKLLLDLQAVWGSGSDRSRIHDLGSGKMSVQLYAQSPGGKALAKIGTLASAPMRMQRRPRSARTQRCA